MPAVVRDGIVETAANIDTAWVGVDAAALFGAELGRPVTVMNDADAAGVAEMTFGAGRGTPAPSWSSPSARGSGAPCSPTGHSSPTPSSVTCPSRAATPRRGPRNRSGNAKTSRGSTGPTGSRSTSSSSKSLLWPELIIIGGGVSKKAEKFLPHIDLRTPLVPAELKNEAGIVGAAVHASHG